MEAPSRLAELQRWLLANISDIGGIEAHTDPLRGQWTSDLIAPSRQQTPEQRLEVYSHAYYARLAECLREMFPVLVKALGREAFEPFANDYISRYPPSSYTLNRLADHFVEYLVETRPTDVPSPGWPDFMIELARLEQTIDHVFDGPGNEGEPPLDIGGLSQLAPAALAGLRFTPAPCLRLLALQFPVNDFYTVCRAAADEPAGFPQPQATWLAVTRREYVVRRVPLAQLEYAVLAELAAGRTLGEALLHVGDVTPSQISSWFADWGRLRFFSRIV
jgi:hypothetical protein